MSDYLMLILVDNLENRRSERIELLRATPRLVEASIKLLMRGNLMTLIHAYKLHLIRNLRRLIHRGKVLHLLELLL
jgi:hypothetical protein